MEDSGLTLNLNYSAPEKLTVQEHKKQEGYYCFLSSNLMEKNIYKST